MPNKEIDILDQITHINAAIDYEIKHMYINAVGNSATFAKFIKKSATEALRVYKHSTKWAAIKALIGRYEFVDVTTRIGLVKQIREILAELEDFYSGVSENQGIDLNSGHSSDTSLEDKSKPFLDLPKITKAEKPSKPVDPNLDISELDVRFIKGVGPAFAEKLNRLDISTCEDLLHYLPRKHISYADKVLIKDLELDQDVTIIGEILKVSAFKSPRKSLVIITIVIADPTGKVKINKFLKGSSTHTFLRQFKGQYPEGAQVLCSGTVKADKYGKQKQISNPVLEVVSGDFAEGRDNIHTARIVPIYPLTEGVSLMQLRKVMHNALEAYEPNFKEFLPQYVLEEYDLMSYQEALKEIHFPSSLESKDKASERLIFNEFFLMQLRFMQKRREVKKEEKSIQFNCFEDGLVDRFLTQLPFTLTGAQQRTFYSEVLPDLVSKFPMHRLLQGDVGSGKTVVAFMTLLIAVDNGYQSALMVPTEILAEQHYRSFKAWAEMIRETGEGLGINVALLTGKMRVREKREVLQGLANGQTNIVVGTHALIQDLVEFDNLGMVIIDEQHRFGVKQRDILMKKGKDGDSKNVERLFMTATPIPRTLALTMHGDLDVSEIDELPPGRSPVLTSVVKRKSEAFKVISDEVAKGRQAYIVFPLIDESESLSAKAATAEYQKLTKDIFPELKIGLMHGRLPDDEKEQVMKDFREAKLDILVSTTVIEVGVDVPNATVMMIESAERFGLAQLHQLRGRVGRGSNQSYCLLCSSSKTEQSMQRLGIMTKTNNGFIVAQEDMKLRGAGDFLGTRQSGLPDFALASLADHEEMLMMARKCARELIAEDPSFEKDEHNGLKQKLKKTAYKVVLSGG